MGKAPCCDKYNVKRGPWSPDEDETLRAYIRQNGTGGNWIAFPKKAGLRRCGKSCRLRWLNYLRPDIRHGAFSEEEDMLIYSLYSQMGTRWSIIASHLQGRTDNDVKNHWNTKLKKKLNAAPTKNNNNQMLNNNCNYHDSANLLDHQVITTAYPGYNPNHGFSSLLMTDDLQVQPPPSASTTLADFGLTEQSCYYNHPGTTTNYTGLILTNRHQQLPAIKIKNQSVSTSQEETTSTISSSFSIGNSLEESYYRPWTNNGDGVVSTDYYYGSYTMDYGLGFWSTLDVVQKGDADDHASERGPNTVSANYYEAAYGELDDVKPQGLLQSVICP